MLFFICLAVENQYQQKANHAKSSNDDKHNFGRGHNLFFLPPKKLTIRKMFICFQDVVLFSPSCGHNAIGEKELLAQARK